MEIILSIIDINDLVSNIFDLTKTRNEDFNIGSNTFYSIRENIEHLIYYL